MRRAKVGIVGAGNVGASAAMAAALKEVGDIALLDVIDGLPQGKGLDQAQTAPIEGYSVKIEGSTDPEVLRGSDVVIVTSGIARKPGMSREDLLKTNAGIVRSVVENVARVAPDCVLIVVTNPLDVMTYHAWKVSGFPPERVVGQAGILDTARYKTFLSMETGISVEDIQAMVLGGHGDTMVPVPEWTTISGVPIGHFVKKDRLDAIIQRTVDGGAEIVKLLKTGSAFYAPGHAAALMAEAILGDRKRLLPCSALLRGEYGIRDVYVGVPVTLGAGGVEKVWEFPLRPETLEALRTSAETYRKVIAELSTLR